MICFWVCWVRNRVFMDATRSAKTMDFASVSCNSPEFLKIKTKRKFNILRPYRISRSPPHRRFLVLHSWRCLCVPPSGWGKRLSHARPSCASRPPAAPAHASTPYISVSAHKRARFTIHFDQNCKGAHMVS